MKSKNEQIKKYILEQIKRRTYLPGQLIESEGQLCDLFDVSRMTIRKALSELETEGIIYKEKGRGTFIAPRPKYSSFKLGVGFSEEVTKRGMIPSTKDSSLELITADDEISKMLGMTSGEKVWKVTRVRCADNIPVVYTEEYYIYELCPGLTIDIINTSTYNYLDEQGVAFAFADQKMVAALCPANVAKKLDIEEGHPMILMDLTVYMKNGVVFNAGREYYRTDKFTITQSIYR